MEYKVPLGYFLSLDVKDPAYGTPFAGCLDFFVPQFDDRFMEDFAKKNPKFDNVQLETMRNHGVIRRSPGDDAASPSGVHARLEPNTALTAFNKSGVATKLRLVRGAEYVDEDYQGEIHLHVINVGRDTVTVEAGQKIVQFSYVPVLRAQLQKCGSREELYPQTTGRGENWQGSTGTK
jgi:dUTP pyrophosphatase